VHILRGVSGVFIAFGLLLIVSAVLQSIGDPQVLLDELRYQFELLDLRGLFRGGSYVFAYLVAVLFFIGVLSLRSSLLFIVSVGFVWLCTAADIFAQLIGITHGVTIDEFRLSLHEADNYYFLSSYLGYVLESLGISSLFVSILIFLRKKLVPVRSHWLSMFFMVGSVVVVYAICYRVFFQLSLSSFPAPVKIPAIAFEAWRSHVPVKKRVLLADVSTVKASHFNNIIWIIDESVTGSYLSINGYNKKTTPYLDSLVHDSDLVSNYGVVNSVSNCSAESNLFLRVGMLPKGKLVVASEMNTLPTIFQYAKRAGYTTWLFDSQAKDGHLQDYLTPYDLESIDHFNTLRSSVPRDKRDIVFLEKIAEIIGRGESGKNFIVAVKYGCHIPYLTTYDQKYSPFKPALKTAYSGWGTANKEAMLNTYRNAVYNSVDRYLERLVKKFDFRDSIVFYTSDHGQNLFEIPGRSRTHCSTDTVVKNEVSVPLMVFTENAKNTFVVDSSLYYSQQQIFPTTLDLMGYGDSVVRQYGPTLAEGYRNSDDRRYILYSSFVTRVYQ